ncbi:alpha/beta fold hydrolase [Egicoccus sp. AB-alg2]|uniref:alpha/beta fold hydrolase n=1 Tax=Egicoccus sp. AB-alg2 TaxID=3242693 RepID=UPI00359CE104
MTPPGGRGHDGRRVGTGTCAGVPVELDVHVAGPEDPAAEVVLLVEGLGMQRVDWPAELLAGLHAAGYRTLTMDNRDAGRSTVLPGRVHDLPRGADGWPVPPYGLADLADDLVAVLDAVGVAEAHVVGRSMGGMVAQHLALAHAERVRSLTSLMSTTGARDVGQVHEDAKWVLTTPPPTDDLDAYLAYVLAKEEAVGSPGHVDPEVVRRRATLTWQRGVHPHGTARQLLAVRADGDRTDRLADVTAPTLVVHGDRDPLIDVSGGHATAKAVPDARLEVVDGMGHDLPAAFVEQAVLPLLLDHLAASAV